MSSKDYELLEEINATSEDENEIQHYGTDKKQFKSESFQKKCINKLKSGTLLKNLVEKLYEAKHLRNFMLLI